MGAAGPLDYSLELLKRFSGYFPRRNKMNNHLTTQVIRESGYDILEFVGTVRDGEGFKVPESVYSRLRALPVVVDMTKFDSNYAAAAMIIHIASSLKSRSVGKIFLLGKPELKHIYDISFGDELKQISCYTSLDQIVESFSSEDVDKKVA